MDEFQDRLVIDVAASVDAGFSRGWFAEALAAVDRFEDDQFLRYGVSAERVDRPVWVGIARPSQGGMGVF